MKVDLKGFNSQEMEEWAIAEGLEPYRGRQIRYWLFRRLASTFDEMSDLPKALRSFLEEKAHLDSIQRIKTEVSLDGTRKFLFRLRDGHFVESVLIPERGHYTVCISSQAGCAMGCRFCVTAKQGLKRNLTPAEIADQVVHLKRSVGQPESVTNIVLMGMGEPLANYEAVLKAVNNLIAEDGMNFSHRKVTLSTCGLVHEIRKLGQDIIVNLAVSLNAADDETRTFLMPINRKHPLKSLLSACKHFPLPNRRRITFEYILIQGINDRDEDAHNLTRLLSSLKVKINLIPLNPHPNLDMVPPPMERIHHFQQILINNNFTAIIRKSKGQDISAACGQLMGNAQKDHDFPCPEFLS